MANSDFHVSTDYLHKLATRMRSKPKATAPAPTDEARNDFGIPIFLPADLRDDRPELDALVVMVRDGCRGVVDLDAEDWRVVCDELTYQIARSLAKRHQINLPNLGMLEIAYGGSGPVGRLTLAPEARP